MNASEAKAKVRPFVLPSVVLAALVFVGWAVARAGILAGWVSDDFFEPWAGSIWFMTFFLGFPAFLVVLLAAEPATLRRSFGALGFIFLGLLLTWEWR